MCEDSVDELAGHFAGALRQIVKRGDGGEDGRSGVGGELHVAQVDAVEGSLADAEDEWATFLKADVGGALDEVRGETVGDGGERSHGAGKNDHAVGGITAAGDVRADVVVCEVLQLRAGCAEEFLGKIVASA